MPAKIRDCHALTSRLFSSKVGEEKLGFSPWWRRFREPGPENVNSVKEPLRPPMCGGRVSEVGIMQPSSVKTDAGIFGLDGSCEGATKETG